MPPGSVAFTWRLSLAAAAGTKKRNVPPSGSLKVTLPLLAMKYASATVSCWPEGSRKTMCCETCAAPGFFEESKTLNSRPVEGRPGGTMVL